MSFTRNVLVVEDEPLIALDLERELVELGYSAATVKSVDSALAAVEVHRLDLVLLNHWLGERVTTQVAERLVERSIPLLSAPARAEMIWTRCLEQRRSLRSRSVETT